MDARGSKRFCNNQNAFVFSGAGSVVWGGAVAALAGLCLNQLLDIIDQQQQEPGSRSSNCIACDGTGYVDCLCTRWQMASAEGRTVHCDKCRGSLKERCPRCGGKGLMIQNLRPQEVPVRREERRDYEFRNSSTQSLALASSTSHSCPAVHIASSSILVANRSLYR
mmetsp:Transcript_10500/g.18937  ORF Transcript_10500/g.18937 Transcript_10500/m.18937 type:complete len:166 (-) Transcript_10500:367-864(-)